MPSMFPENLAPVRAMVTSLLNRIVGPAQVVMMRFETVMAMAMVMVMDGLNTRDGNLKAGSI